MDRDLIAGVIPESALALHVILLGKTRSGKSSKARIIVEHCLDRHQPVGIIDPKGDWWGIKLSATGRSAGFSVVIFGGEHADVKINEHSGAKVAELVATENRPFLIDLGGWMPAKRTRFFIDFASTFFIKTRGQRVLVIDEVHNFAPQGRVMDPETGKALHWANRLASEGGGRGITLISASQRPQKVHKDFVTSHETLIACKVIHKLDRDAVKDWIDGCGDPEHGREVFKTLGTLPKPQAWVWCPEIKFGPSLVTFPMFKTYDSFKPQEAGDAAKLKGWASVDLAEVNEKMAAVIAEEDAKDPVKLRAALAKANASIAALEKKGAVAVPELGIDAAEARGFERAKKEALAEAKKEVAAAIAAIEGDLNPMAAAVKSAIEVFRAAVADRLKSLARANRAETLVYSPAPAAVRPAPKPAATTPPARAVTADSDDRPLQAERKPLAVLAAVLPAGMTEAQWAVASKLKRTGGTWSTYLSRLRMAGRIEERDGLFFCSERGLADLDGNVPPMPPPGPALIRFWGERVSGADKLLNRLAEIFPEWTTREQLAADLNLAADGGTFGTYLSRLRSPGLIEESGDQLRAATHLLQP